MTAHELSCGSFGNGVASGPGQPSTQLAEKGIQLDEEEGKTALSPILSPVLDQQGKACSVLELFTGVRIILALIPDDSSDSIGY